MAWDSNIDYSQYQENLQVYTVDHVAGALNQYIKDSVFSSQILISGEVVNFKFQANKGWAFFTLKGVNASIECVQFNRNRDQSIKDGSKVLAKGRFDYNTQYGRLSFKVDALSFDGEGEILKKLKELKERLLKEGIFDDEHKKPIPKYLKNICLLTAKEGAVIHDIEKKLRERNKAIDLKYYSVMVQGIYAVESIVSALEFLDTKNFDVILIARGGGSEEDLRVFSDERLIRAIYSAKTPIAVAIGHESDHPFVELVADAYFKTPTDAAERLSYNEKEELAWVLDQTSYMTKIISDAFNSKKTAYNLYENILLSAKDIIKFKFQNSITKSLNEIDVLIKNKIDRFRNYLYRHLDMGAYVNGKIVLSREKINSIKSTLNVLDYNNTLKRGYYIVKKSKNNFTELKSGDKIEIMGYNEKAKIKIDEIEVELKNGK